MYLLDQGYHKNPKGQADLYLVVSDFAARNPGDKREESVEGFVDSSKEKVIGIPTDETKEVLVFGKLHQVNKNIFYSVAVLTKTMANSSIIFEVVSNLGVTILTDNFHTKTLSVLNFIEYLG